MLTLDVHRFMLGHLRGRPPLYQSAAQRPEVPVRTFSDGSKRIHIVFDKDLCRTVLESPQFRQPAYLDFLSRRIGGDGTSCLADDFFANNPIALNGAEHEAARQRYLRRYNALRKSIAPELRAFATEAVSALTRAEKTAHGFGAVAAYLDRIAARLIEAMTGTKPDSADLAGPAACVFEILPSQAALARKEAQTRRLLNMAQDAQVSDPLDRAILLSFLHQGRDPIHGALAGLLLHLAGATSAERATILGDIDGSGVFHRTHPVNYISRAAAQAIDIDGTQIETGEIVFLCLASTAQPDQERGLAFGAGAHVCAGQALSFDIVDAWLDALRAAAPNVP